ncbi:MAG: NADH-quinone oxidoreductase subunit NuoE [Gammaproteobacteria bacterium]|nr:NADH-quinone oxidoreductase subunit NuoE [Gammaproteobacteria bacterium]
MSLVEQALKQTLPTPARLAVLDKSICRRIDYWVSLFPPEHKRSAVISALREVQHHNDGFLTTELMDAVAAYLKLSRIAVYEVASFYSMLETRPVGRCCIAVCTNLSCMLRGSDTIVNHLQKRLGVELGESTPDNRYYLKREEECLAACAGAPMMQVDHKYYTDLTPERVDDILDKLESAATTSTTSAKTTAKTPAKATAKTTAKK